MVSVVFFCVFFLVDVRAQNCTVCLNLIHALRSSTVPDQTIAVECPDEECAVFFMSQLDNLIVAIHHRDNEDRDICKMLNFCADEQQAKETDMFIESKLKCAVCVASLRQIWERLAMDARSSDIVSILNETCPKYPTSERFCRSLQMKGSVSMILSGLLGNKTPRTTCSSLNLCSSENNSLKPTQQEGTNLGVVAKPSNGVSRVKCDVCQGIYLFAKSFKSDPNNQLASFCKMVPPNLKDSCDQLLQYGGLFDLALSSDSDAFTACKTVNFCSEEDLVISSPTTAVAGSIPSLQCQACQWAVSATESYFSQDSNVEELAYVLENLCTVLPYPPYQDVCKNFVELYLDEIVLVFLDNITPPVVCTKLITAC